MSWDGRTVFVWVFTHKHGLDVFVYKTYEAALQSIKSQALMDIERGRIDDAGVCAEIRQLAKDGDLEGVQDALNAYWFNVSEGDVHTIHETSL